MKPETDEEVKATFDSQWSEDDALRLWTSYQERRAKGEAVRDAAVAVMMEELTQARLRLAGMLGRN